MFSKFRLKLVGDIPVIPKVINLMALNRKDHEIFSRDLQLTIPGDYILF